MLPCTIMGRKKRHRELNIEKRKLALKTRIDIQGAILNDIWPFSYKIGNAYLCCVILSLSRSLSVCVLFHSLSFLPSAVCLRRLPRSWGISIMARSPYIQLISLLFYSNWQYFHTIMLYLLTAWILSKQARQKCGYITGSPLILGDRVGIVPS